MARTREELFLHKKALLNLFKVQISLLKEADPSTWLAKVDVSAQDALVAGGPNIKWPAGMYSGLQQGVRDVQAFLLEAYGPRRRGELFRRLREAAGPIVDALEQADAARVLQVRRRGRIRNENEYYLIRDALDRVEMADTPDEALRQELQDLCDAANIG
jgi:hypothetical protein